MVPWLSHRAHVEINSASILTAHASAHASAIISCIVMMAACTTPASTASGKDALTAAKNRTMIFVASEHALSNDTLYTCLEESSTLSAASKRTYLSNLRSLQTRLATELLQALKLNTQVFVCPQTDDYRLYSIIASVPAAPDCVRYAASIPLRTRAAFSSAVLALYKHSTCVTQASTPHLMAAKPAWERLCAELSAELDAKAKESRLSEREEKAWCSFTELQDRVTQLSQEQPGSRGHLLLAFYVLWPPLRGGDAARIRLVAMEEPTHAGDDGILVWRGENHPAELILTQHKTEKHYGPIRRTVPPELRKVIAASLQLEPREYLFTQARTTTPFASATAFTNYANNLLRKVMGGRPVTCNTLRHSFISALDVSALTLAQQEQLAAWMGHSVAQQGRYRRVTGARGMDALQAADGTLSIPIRH